MQCAQLIRLTWLPFPPPESGATEREATECEPLVESSTTR
jgi:hypothetical protein